MPVTRFFEFLSESMLLLATEVPDHYESLARELFGFRVRITANGIRRDAYFAQSGFQVDGPKGQTDVEIAFDGETVLALIDGETTLEKALLADDIFILGPVEAVERFFSAIVIYVNGSLRSNGFLRLLTDYRNDVLHQP